MREEWKPVVGYEGLYMVSNIGRIYGLKRKNFVSVCIRKDGYTKVGLYKKGVRTHHGVHRLVALAFVDNPLYLPQVNHIDENKTNNSADNLEWCTAKENVNYGTRTKRASDSCKKVIQQIDKNGIVVGTYLGLKAAAEAVGGKSRSIGACCEGRQKSSKGFYWRYMEDK